MLMLVSDISSCWDIVLPLYKLLDKTSVSARIEGRGRYPLPKINSFQVLPCYHWKRPKYLAGMWKTNILHCCSFAAAVAQSVSHSLSWIVRLSIRRSRKQQVADKMWQLLLELLFCAAVITFAPSTHIGLGVWALAWWTSVFWRWATSPSPEAATTFPALSSHDNLCERGNRKRKNKKWHFEFLQ